MKEKVCFALVDEDGNILADSRIKTQADCAALIQQNGKKYKVVQVKISENKKASITARALIHVWFKTLAGYIGEDPATTKQIIKIKFGIPVLLADPETSKAMAWMLEKVEWKTLSWQAKLRVCEMFIPVTSIASPAALKEIMNNVKDWAMSEHNVTLDNGKRD